MKVTVKDTLAKMFCDLLIPLDTGFEDWVYSPELDRFTFPVTVSFWGNCSCYNSHYDHAIKAGRYSTHWNIHIPTGEVELMKV